MSLCFLVQSFIPGLWLFSSCGFIWIFSLILTLASSLNSVFQILLFSPIFNPQINLDLLLRCSWNLCPNPASWVYEIMSIQTTITKYFTTTKIRRVQKMSSQKKWVRIIYPQQDQKRNGRYRWDWILELLQVDSAVEKCRNSYGKSYQGNNRV